ncbi:MAG: acyltransferase [Lysobacter sp.]|nr:MAG: acyltransferase [Lysobacter sp.]
MSTDWKQRPEGGGLFALWLIRSIGRYGGRAVSRLLLYPITLYFLIRRGPERLASRQWLDRALGRPATLWDVAKHIHTFASTILDRVFLPGDGPERMARRFDVDVTGLDVLHRHLDTGKGMLLFGSHLGSFEVLRVLARKRPEYTIRVVLDRAHNPAVTQLLEALNPEVAATVIDAGQDGPALMLAIQEAVQQGALVALLVDRAQPGAPTLSAPFFGRPAAFPTAPWSIAMALKAPITLAFGLYRGGRRYDLRFEHFCDALDVPRAQRGARLAELVRNYVARLEAVARSAPYNWFNFYNVWEDAARGHADAPHTDPAARRDAEPADVGSVDRA